MEKFLQYFLCTKIFLQVLEIIDWHDTNFGIFRTVERGLAINFHEYTKLDQSYEQKISLINITL